MPGRPIGNFYVQLGLNTQTFRRNLAEAQRDLRNAFGTAAIHASEVLAASIGAIGAALAGLSVKAVQFSADLDKQRIALERMLGSTEAAIDKIKELQQFAAKTGFAFSDLVDYQKRLMAVGFTAEETSFMLYQIADATAIIGNDADKISRLIKAFGDVKAKGNLQTQEIKQFAELGIPAWDMLSKAIGKSRDELTKLVEGRKISADTALWAITSEIQKRWGGMAEDISKTLSGAFNRLKAVVQIEMTELGDWLKENVPISDIFNGITEAVLNTAEAIKTSGLMGAFDTFAEKFPNIVKGLQLIGEALVIAVLPGMASLAMYISMITIPLLKLVGIGLIITEILPQIASSVIDAIDMIKALLEQSWLVIKENALKTLKQYLDDAYDLFGIQLRVLGYDIKTWVAVTFDKTIDSIIKRILGVANIVKNIFKNLALGIISLIEDVYNAFEMYIQGFWGVEASQAINKFIHGARRTINDTFGKDFSLENRTNVLKKTMGIAENKGDRKKARDAYILEVESKPRTYFNDVTDKTMKKWISDAEKARKVNAIATNEAWNNFWTGANFIGKTGDFFAGLKAEGTKLWDSLVNPVKKISEQLKSPWGNNQNPVGGGEAKINIPSVKTKEAKEKAIKENFGDIGIEAGNPLTGLTGYGFVYGKALSDEFAKLVKAHEESEKLRKSIFDLRVEIANGFTDAFTTAMTASGNFFHNLGEGFKKLGDQILKQIAQMLIFSTILRVLGINYDISGFTVNPIFKKHDLPVSDHATDGVIQNGKLISTHPDDYIIATKDPSSLGNKANVVVNVNNNSSSEVSTNSYFDGTREIIDIVISGISRNVSGSKDFFRSL